MRRFCCSIMMFSLILMLTVTGCQKNSTPTKTTTTISIKGADVSRDLQGNVKSVRFGENHPGDTELTQAAKLKTIKEVFADAPDATDKALSAFQDAEGIQKISLTNSQITGAAFADFVPAELTYLDLSGSSSLDPSQLEPLKGHGSLKSLILNDTPVTDEIVELAKTCPKLTEIRLIGTSITNEGVSKLVAAMPELKQFSIGSAEITDEAIQPIAELKSLKNLEIVNSSISDDGVKLLTSLESLELLRLNKNSNLTDTGVHSLGSLPNLSHLEVSETQFSGAKFKTFGFKRLNALYANATQVSDDTIADFNGLPQLYGLMIYDTKVTPEVVQKSFHSQHQTAVSYTGKPEPAGEQVPPPQ